MSSGLKVTDIIRNRKTIYKNKKKKNARQESTSYRRIQNRRRKAYARTPVPRSPLMPIACGRRKLTASANGVLVHANCVTRTDTHIRTHTYANKHTVITASERERRPRTVHTINVMRDKHTHRLQHTACVETDCWLLPPAADAAFERSVGRRTDSPPPPPLITRAPP